MSTGRYIFVLACGIFTGFLLADLWKAPYHGMHITVGGAVAAAIASAYLLWRRHKAST